MALSIFIDIRSILTQTGRKQLGTQLFKGKTQRIIRINYLQEFRKCMRQADLG